MPIAEKEYRLATKRLKAMIVDSEYSLRGLCEKTQKLGPHERIYHSNMSEIFRHTGKYNLSLQQFIMILKLLGTTPEAFFAGSREASTIADAFEKLDAKGKRAIAKSMATKLANVDGTKTITQRLLRLSRD